DGYSAISFSTFNADGSEAKHEIEVNDGDTIGAVIMKINNSDSPVRAFYDTETKNVIMETTRTGKYNKSEDGPEIVFNSDFFSSELGLKEDSEKGGTNAVFTYNNGDRKSTRLSSSHVLSSYSVVC